MSRKSKYSIETKIAACEDYLSENYSHEEICEKYNISFHKKSCTSMLNEWIPRYREHGADAFIHTNKNQSYSAEFKMQAVEEYISGKGSQKQVSAKYNLRSKTQLQNWISLYNANRELKDYDPKMEVYMAEARRKTTIEERKEIVAYCINNNRNYKDTAALYNVSYSQVYSWVKKYDTNGEEALTDKRGRHKSDDEVDELERLKRENLRLKRQLEEKDMLTELLKKVKEFEGM